MKNFSRFRFIAAWTVAAVTVALFDGLVSHANARVAQKAKSRPHTPRAPAHITGDHGKKASPTMNMRKASRVPAGRRPQVNHRTPAAKKAARIPAGRRPNAKRRNPSKPSVLPVARETAVERDMPFVSVPHRRVGGTNRMIVMEDPAAPAKPPAEAGPATVREPAAIDLHSDQNPLRNP